MRKFFVLMLALVAAHTTFSNGTVDPNAEKETGTAIIRAGSTFKVFYKETEKADVQVQIFDASDRLVFSEKLKDLDGFIRPYNFNGLDEGEYTIVLKSDLGKRHVERVEYRNKHIAPLVSVVKMRSEEKYVVLIPHTKDEVVSISIQDRQGNRVYYGTEKLTNDFSALYNLSKFDGGFTFTITDAHGNSKVVQY